MGSESYLDYASQRYIETAEKRGRNKLLDNTYIYRYVSHVCLHMSIEGSARLRRGSDGGSALLLPGGVASWCGKRKTQLLDQKSNYSGE